ncbi:MAG: RNA helicase, partial [Clostridia bacterium]|nr:RNA helicase [Clostridia bacterium]
CCQLLRSSLKKELYKLKTRRYAAKPGSAHRREEIRKILKARPKNCAYQICQQTQKKKELLDNNKSRLNRRIKELERHSRDYEVEFNNMWDLLEKMNFVEGRTLLPRGKFALRLYIQEILVTELLFQGYLRDRPAQEVVAVLAGVDYIPGREEYTPKSSIDLEHIKKLIKFLARNRVPENLCVWSPLPASLAVSWYEGESFDNLLNSCSLQEGDLFSLLRRTIDLLRQIERAAGEDLVLKKQMEQIRHRLDRDEVAIMGF